MLNSLADLIISRKYLSDVLQHRLATELGSEYSIFVSKEDRDPLQTA